MTFTKKEQNVGKTNKKQNEKSITQTPKTVPNKTHTNDQCRYCKKAGHMMAECPKLAKRRKPGDDPDAEKCQNCNTPDMMKKIVTSVRIWKIANPNGP